MPETPVYVPGDLLTSLPLDGSPWFGAKGALYRIRDGWVEVCYREGVWTPMAGVNKGIWSECRAAAPVVSSQEEKGKANRALERLKRLTQAATDAVNKSLEASGIQLGPTKVELKQLSSDVLSWVIQAKRSLVIYYPVSMVYPASMAAIIRWEEAAFLNCSTKEVVDVYSLVVLGCKCKPADGEDWV